jgi:hypothetical protein
MGFHYVVRDGTRIIQERNNFQKRKINENLLLSCISQKLDDRMQDRNNSTPLDKIRKQAILEAFRREVGQDSRQLGDFWKVYRNVMKSVDFYALKEVFDFAEFRTTRYLRECLQEQIKGIFGFNTLNRMSYP